MVRFFWGPGKNPEGQGPFANSLCFAYSFLAISDDGAMGLGQLLS